MALARSSAHRSATSATTTITEGSRRGSTHTVQGFWVSILPQVRHTSILSIAVWIAAASGLISCSRFLMRCSAARRAERGPRPGRRASNWIRRSISGPATAAGIGVSTLRSRDHRWLMISDRAIIERIDGGEETMLARQIAIGFGIAMIFPLLVYYGVATFNPPPRLQALSGPIRILPQNATAEERNAYLEERKADSDEQQRKRDAYATAAKT